MSSVYFLLCSLTGPRAGELADQDLRRRAYRGILLTKTLGGKCRAWGDNDTLIAVLVFRFNNRKRGQGSRGTPGEKGRLW